MPSAANRAGKVRGEFSGKRERIRTPEKEPRLLKEGVSPSPPGQGGLSSLVWIENGRGKSDSNSASQPQRREVPVAERKKGLQGYVSSAVKKEYDNMGGIEKYSSF